MAVTRDARRRTVHERKLVACEDGVTRGPVVEVTPVISGRRMYSLGDIASSPSEDVYVGPRDPVIKQSGINRCEVFEGPDGISAALYRASRPN